MPGSCHSGTLHSASPYSIALPSIIKIFQTVSELYTENGKKSRYKKGGVDNWKPKE